MRAFLSLTTDEFDGARSVGMLATIGHDGRTARTIAAEMEVRRILAETEPEDANAETVELALHPVIRREQGAHPDPIVKGCNALAESLAAFIALPIGESE